MGKWLRTTYGSLLGDQYDQRKIYIRSTDRDRTIESAQLALIAMFPPSGYQLWKKDLKWQPIAVHTVDRNEDYLIGSRVPSSCLKYQNEYQQLSAIENAKLDIKYKQLLNTITKNVGIQFNSSMVAVFKDTLYAEESNKLK